MLGTLARAAPDAGIELDLVSLNAADDGRTAMLDVLRASGLQPRFLNARRLIDPAAIPRLVAEIRRSRCDIVHAHLEYSTILATIAARVAGRPAVCTLHHMPEALPRRDAVKESLAVRIGGRSKALIFVSHAARDAFAARYHVRPRTWTVVHNGVDLDAFAATSTPRTALAELGLPAGAPVVAMVAALRGRKGHEVLIDAWTEIAERIPGARALLVGDGPDEAALRDRARARGVDDLLVFCGRRDDVAAVMLAADIVVLPSEIEALPTALIEAGACGRAVVATAVGGVTDVVEDGTSGILVAPGDVRAFAEAVVRLLAAPADRVAMGRAGRAVVEERFDMHRWAARLRDVYAAAITGSRSGG